MTMAFTVEQFTTAVIAALCIMAVVKWLRHATSTPPRTRLPPCIPSVPVFGSLPFMSCDPNGLHRYFLKNTAKYGNVFACYLGSKYAVVLNRLDTITEALSEKALHFADRAPFFFNTVLNPDRKGISAAPYDAAFRRKRQLYLSILKKLDVGQRAMENRINVEVTELIDQIRLKGGQPFDPNELIHKCVLNVALNVLFGRRYSYGHPTLNEIRDGIKNWFNSIVQEVELFWFLRYAPSFRRRVQNFLKVEIGMLAMIEREVNITLWNAGHDKADSSRDNFVSQFVELTKKKGSDAPLIDAEFDRKELYETVQNLLTGGDDTTSTVIRWILLEIANRPDVQSRLQKEVDSIIGTDRVPSLADEPRMPYVQAVVLETLRRYAPIPLSVYRATTCDTQVAGCFIGAETTVIVNLYSAHMDPLLWNEPSVFKPDRFLDDDGQITGKDRMVAFSIGKRACPGEPLSRQNLFLFITGIIQNFTILPPEGQKQIAAEERTILLLEPTAFQARFIARNN